MKPSIRRFFKTYFSNSMLLLATGVFVLGWTQSCLSQTSPLTIKKRPPAQPVAPGARPPARPGNKLAPKKGRPKKGAGKKSNSEESELAEPERVVLSTSDGVKLTVTYFAPPAAEDGEAKRFRLFCFTTGKAIGVSFLSMAPFFRSRDTR